MDGLARPEDSRAPELEDSLLRQVALAELPLRTPRPGERLGGKTGDRFEILEKLGTGAMGQVFQAWDEELQRIVALKFLRSHAPLAEERLLTVVREEARAIARLNHENIVHVFDVSEWKGQPWEPEVPFLIMEHLEGTSLASILAQGQLTLRRSLELMSTITAGLAHAHEHHIVHRDLKPSNVFVLRKGQVKLIDFGLAHYTVNSALHLPTAGTPAYMAPEQWRGEAQDARTDVWAAGIMLHEMLTGAFPYPMTTPAELRAWVTSTAPVPSPLQRHPELPQQVEVLLSRALAKDPTRRFPTAAEFHAALSQLMEVLGPWRPEPQPLGPQRRQVTLVCCRLEGRASPLQTFDTEESGEMEAAFQRSCSKLLREHGGMIASCIGDQVLACFGHPLAQEDDSEHAVRAGLNLVSALRQELPRPLPGTFTVKVGIHTGLVVLDDMPMEARGWTPAIQGEAPQLAEWLARHTAPDTVVLSDTTWMLVRGAFVTEACAPLSYAGRAGPRELELRRVVRERRTPLRFDRSRLGGLTPLVGREQEVQQLTSSWATAKSGRGAFVLVSGEAGIGKSRLIRELRQHASPEPHLRLQCQCWAQFQTSAFYPVVEALQRLFRMAPQDAPSQRLHMLEEQLRALDMEPEHVRLIALFLSLPIAEESPHLRLSPQLQKEKTFEALEVLFQRLTRKHPLLVVVEDLHWADPSTLELLGFLIERLAGHRLLMLLSTRPGFLSSWAPGPELQKMTLERLPTHRTAALVREATHGRALPPEMIEYLVARTDGIPLFVEEMTRMVLERPCSSASKPSSFIPSTLHELLLSQLDLLPHQQRALAQLCAVVGRSFDHSLLVAIANRTDAGLKRDLAGLLDSGLLQQQDELAEPRYQFRHALIQEAASHSLPRSTRRQHHRRIVQVLAEQFPEVAETQPEWLAHHYTEAGEVQAAISWWARAGERDSLRSANTESVSHFTQALALLGHLADSPERTCQELRLRSALGLPLLQLRGYGSVEVEQTYERARVLMREVGDALPQVELSYWSLFHYHHSRARFDLLQEMGNQLVALGRRQHNLELLILGHRAITGAAYPQGDFTRALEHVNQVLSCSEFELPQQRALAVKHWVNSRVAALSLGAILHALLGRPDCSHQYTQEAVELARRIAHPHTSAFALTYAAATSQILRNPKQASEWAQASMELAWEHRLHLWVGWSALLQLWADTELGNTHQELQSVRQGLAQAQSSGLRAHLPLFFGVLAEMHRKLGQTEAGLGALREAQEWVDTTNQRFYEAEQHRLEGELLRQRGLEHEAGECFSRAISVARQQHALLFELRATVSLSRQLQEQGRADEARQRLKAICARFAPELECVDLTEARELLARLMAPPREG